MTARRRCPRWKSLTGDVLEVGSEVGNPRECLEVANPGAHGRPADGAYAQRRPRAQVALAGIEEAGVETVAGTDDALNTRADRRLLEEVGRLVEHRRPMAAPLEPPLAGSRRGHFLCELRQG